MSFSGTYNITINTPMGKQEGELKLDDSAGLTGSMSSQGESTDIENGAVDGDTATWDVKVSKPMPLTLSFTAKRDGDSIGGTVKLGAFGEAAFEGSVA